MPEKQRYSLMRIRERAAATVLRVHVSLQRDGDIPLQAHTDLDKNICQVRSAIVSYRFSFSSILCIILD